MSHPFKKKSDLMKNSNKITIDMAQKTINEIKKLIKEKLFRIQTIIQNTLSQFSLYRKFEILSNVDLTMCSTSLSECYEKCRAMMSDLDGSEKYSTVENIDWAITDLQSIIDKLSIIMCGYGTKYMEDIFFISFGTEIDASSVPLEVWRDKYEMIMKYVRPIGYKTIHWKNCKTKPKNVGDFGTLLCANKMTEECIPMEQSRQYECYEIDLNARTTSVKIYGIRVVIHDEKTQKTLIIQGVVDDVPLECMSGAYIKERKGDILANIPASDAFDPYLMGRLVDTMTLKDILILGNEDLYKKHMMVMSEVNYVKYNKLNITIKKFLEMDVYGQRHMLMNLLIYDKDIDIQYITYLLYDLITSKSGMDSAEQHLIYDSFPWKVKMYFKDAMKNTIKYTKDMINKYDINRISLEQQVYVMKAPENVKEKAMAKLKEIKGKSDDTGAKAKQYLEGLLKIPFHVYKEEAILQKQKTICREFLALASKHASLFEDAGIRVQSKYTTYELLLAVAKIDQHIMCELSGEMLAAILPKVPKKVGTAQLHAIYTMVAEDRQLSNKKTATKDEKFQMIESHLTGCSRDTLAKIYDVLNVTGGLSKTVHELDRLKGEAREISGDLDQIVATLDESIHGHTHAKRQILKIIAQWMNGEQTGYCFGFEGSPGIGKTSLAKRGLAKCLKDANGDSRPFAFIALGGSCNGSTLEGHSYTYVNSTWGKIVDILMDTKCMNPIIYVDELDKVSKTEHGKEIIGILTHLIDTTQNSGFQDKYFSGIDVDLSKALFIFSYNDPAQIDSILLDRIHRIRFDNLSLDDKVTVAKKHVLPELNRKMGIENCVVLSDDVIEHIIQTYTLESGVRKLKEVLFDLYGEINLELLRGDDSFQTSLPIDITMDDLRDKYLTKYERIREKMIHTSPEVGVINGLWANSLGMGGIIPIQTMFFPSTTLLDLRLTGMQGDVMKESMNVAKTLAWQQMSEAEQEKIKCQGLHIHCPEGAVSKDGPSAGTAITIAIYSRLTGKPIRNEVAITGEINLQSQITEIGGLEQKVLGGIRAGVRKFLYPQSNETDFQKIKKKYGEKPFMVGIEFVAVDRLEQALPHFIDP